MGLWSRFKRKEVKVVSPDLRFTKEEIRKDLQKIRHDIYNTRGLEGQAQMIKLVEKLSLIHI